MVVGVLNSGKGKGGMLGVGGWVGGGGGGGYDGSKNLLHTPGRGAISHCYKATKQLSYQLQASWTTSYVRVKLWPYK